MLAVVFSLSSSHAVGATAGADHDLGIRHLAGPHCHMDFEATVDSGPSAGLSLVGELMLAVDSAGSASGLLARPDGSEMTVTGQVNGRAINLAFDLGNDRYIFGAGTSLKPISECDGVLGGPLTGPERGDLGDWKGVKTYSCPAD